MVKLPILALILLSIVLGDIKILNTLDGKLGSEPCTRICSGVDKDYTGWRASFNRGKVWKTVEITGCDFISTPIVTAVSGSHNKVCPSFTVPVVVSNNFKLYTVEDYTADKMAADKCKVFWTAVGFVC